MDVFQPNSEDFLFNFRKIQKGYASIEFLLTAEKEIKTALQCLARIEGNPVLANICQPENIEKKLRSHLATLRRAVQFWNSDFKPNQREYANVVKMAYDDCAAPLGKIDEAANVLKRALNEESFAAVSGIDKSRLEKAYGILHRMRLLMREFANELGNVSKIGNMVAVAGSVPVEEILGRPVLPRKQNPVFEPEGLFWGITGVLHAEKDNILMALGKVKPPSESERLRGVFSQVTDRVSDYAIFAIDKPSRAITMLVKDVPDCLEAIKAAMNHMDDETDQAMLSVLEHCITSLLNHQQARD